MPRASRDQRRKPRQANAVPARRPDHERVWAFAALGIILLVSGLRLLHLGFPLERDEGEFGYIAQEILRGIPPYVSAFTQKLPGTYLVYALILALFGQTITAIHVGLLLTNAAIMGLIFVTLRRTHGGLAGCVGALVFGVMGMSPTVFGFAGHATFFVSLFAMAGLYAMLRARERGSVPLFLLSGLGFGLATLMKQQGLFFAPLALVPLAADHLFRTPRRLARFLVQGLALAAGAAAPLVLTAAYYAVIGKFGLFWFWTIQFAGEFTGQVGPAQAVRNLISQTHAATSGFEILWLLALVGLVVMLRDQRPGTGRYAYAAFAAAAALSVVPGFYFTNHYYISALPAVALLVGAMTTGVTRRAALQRQRWETAAVLAITGLGLVIGVAVHQGYYFGSVPDREWSRRIYRGNPFPESIAIGEYLKDHTTPQDRIAILGSETQILFYAQRRSASRFVNTYYLTAHQPRNRAMQLQMIHDIERARPKYLLLVAIPMSWMFRSDSPRDIVEWMNRYPKGRYDLVGLLRVFHNESVLQWGAEARAQHVSPSDFYLAILRRLDRGAGGR